MTPEVLTTQERIEALFDAVDEGTDLYSCHLEGNMLKVYFKDYRGDGTRKNVYVLVPIAEASIVEEE